jgi:long-chain acyl-CoA synthetase
MPEIPAPRSPLAYLYEREKSSPDLLYLVQPVKRDYREFSWGRVAREARSITTALREIGIKPGDKVAILSKNCAEWIIADLAIMMAECISVPIYSTANRRTIEYVLEHSGAKAIFVGKLDDYQEQSAGIESRITRIAMPYETMDAHHQWNDLLESHAPFAGHPEPDLDEVMTLLYTSGSTGQPKGAVHTYRNFEFAGRRIGLLMGTRPDDRILSYLPLAHCTERAYVEASTLVHGGILWFTESLATFPEDMKNCRPTIFGSVPRLWKRFQMGILARMPARKLAIFLKIPLLSTLVRNKIKKGMGLDDCRWFMSGSAPIAPALLQWWADLGMPISEGWGMTETLAYGTLLPVGEEIRIGSIGKTALDTDIRVTEEGEIQIRTGSLMTGYFNDADKTAEAITDDGFLRTGDRGRVDGDGYIFITGRVKDIYKTAKGKYVAPVPIESLIARNPLIEQSCVIGSGMKQPVALIELTEGGLDGDREEMTAALESTRLEVNAQLESHERIDRFVVVLESWTVDNGLLTPTLKIKRHELEVRYGELVRTPFENTLVIEPD